MKSTNADNYYSAYSRLGKNADSLIKGYEQVNNISFLVLVTRAQKIGNESRIVTFLKRIGIISVYVTNFAFSLIMLGLGFFSKESSIGVGNAEICLAVFSLILLIAYFFFRKCVRARRIERYDFSTILNNLEMYITRLEVICHGNGDISASTVHKVLDDLALQIVKLEKGFDQNSTGVIISLKIARAKVRSITRTGIKFNILDGDITPYFSYAKKEWDRLVRLGLVKPYPKV